MWECALDGCGHRTETAEALLVHQVTDHERVRCAVCGLHLPDGYFAIRHVFSEHTRTEYRRWYDEDPAEIKRREAVLDAVEAEADVEAVLAELRTAAGTEE